MISSSSLVPPVTLVVLAVIGFTPGREQRRAAATPVSRVEVVRSYPHDPEAFTQGLVVNDGALYESTGQHGQSSIRKVRLETGEVLKIRKLEDRYFGEGMAVVGKSIVQLTWQSGVGFVYDKESFERTSTFTYTGEGWGLTYDGKRLIMSDGTASLRFLDPVSLKETGRMEVRDAGRPVPLLNELEVVKGEILANVWQTSRIARISPASGTVTGWLDLSGLLDPRESRGADVLNGIAYDAAKDRLFVTGKLWPKLFEIRIP